MKGRPTVGEINMTRTDQATGTRPGPATENRQYTIFLADKGHLAERRKAAIAGNWERLGLSSLVG